MKCTCPNCGSSFENKAKKSAIKPEQPTIDRDGKIYYGLPVRYAFTGQETIAYASFPSDMKAIERDKKRREKRIEQMRIKENNAWLESRGLGITDAWVIDYLKRATDYRNYSTK